MSSAWLSVVGLYYDDESIFDDMVLPDGVDRDTVKDSILLETAELEVILTDPQKFKMALKIWSKKRLATWQRIWNVLLEKYNPLENYRRNETRTIARDIRNVNEDHSIIGAENQGEGSETFRPNETETISRTGFNSNAFQDTERSTKTGTDNTETSFSNESQSVSDRNGESNTDEDTQEEALIFGNIGVVSSQTMLLQEVEVARINITEIIVEEFKESFCVMVY